MGLTLPWKRGEAAPLKPGRAADLVHGRVTQHCNSFLRFGPKGYVHHAKYPGRRDSQRRRTELCRP
jgi:hypothetical protein